jgi:hypothetical protein
LHETVRWYRSNYEEGRPISEEQLGLYVECARQQGVAWAQ